MAPVSKKYFEAKGTRKSSTARVRIYKGKKPSVINGLPLEEYYPDKLRQEQLLKPLAVAGILDKFYFSAKVKGGGRLTGQRDSIMLGIARAIMKWDPDKREILRKEGLITRDPRQVERKKYFLLKARKRPQFSKR